MRPKGNASTGWDTQTRPHKSCYLTYKMQWGGSYPLNLCWPMQMENVCGGRLLTVSLKKRKTLIKRHKDLEKQLRDSREFLKDYEDSLDWRTYAEMMIKMWVIEGIHTEVNKQLKDEWED